jgi:putative sterol carrier protein
MSPHLQLDPMNAFMGGKLKIGGNIMLAQKLTAIFDAAKPKAKL